MARRGYRRQGGAARRDGHAAALRGPRAAAARRAARAARGRRRRGGRARRRSAPRSRFYRAHLHEGRDAASLAALRGALRRGDAAGARARRPPARPRAELTAALLDALAFSAYPDAAPALRALRAAGCALVVVSNWDVSLHERLAETGLAPLVDGAVASAELGRGQARARDLRARAGARGRRAPSAPGTSGDDVARGRRGRARGRDPAGARRARRAPRAGARGRAERASTRRVPASRCPCCEPGRIARPRRARRPLALCGPDVEPPPPSADRPGAAAGASRAAGGRLAARAAGRRERGRRPAALAAVGAVRGDARHAARRRGRRRRDRAASSSSPGVDTVGRRRRRASRSAATYVQDLALIGAALLLARLLDPPATPGKFGLRLHAPGPAVGWTLLCSGRLLRLRRRLGHRARHHRGGRPARGARRRRIDGARSSAVSLLVCVLAPIAEELFFRGFCFTALRRALGHAACRRR